MSIKDLTIKSELFAKLALKRVAQSAGDPLAGQIGTTSLSDPKYVTDPATGKQKLVDPGQLQDSRSPEQIAEEVNKNFPYLTKAPTGVSAPQAAKPGAAAAVAVPAQAAALLAPYKGKGMLQVALNGKNLNVVYNARTMSDTGLQAKLQKALPGYTVSVLGKTEFPPQMANY